MEALAVLGVGAALVQFVDTGLRWTNTSIELYNSAAGALAENLELETVCEDIRILAEESQLGEQSADDAKLQALLTSCCTLAEELLKLLLSLKVDKNKSQRIEVFKKSIKAVRTKSLLKAVQQRLFIVRDQVCVHLQMTFSYVPTKLRKIPLTKCL